MDDAWSALGASRQGRSPRDQRVDQRVVPVTRSRVHHQAGGFVDHCQMLVLEDDAEGNGPGLKSPRRFGLRQANGNGLTPGEQPRRPRGFPLDADPLGGNKPRCLSSGESELTAEEAIQTLGLRADDCKRDLRVRFRVQP